MYNKNFNIRFGGPITPVVKKIMIINGGIFLFQILFKLISNDYFLVEFFGLSFTGFFENFKIWQIFTYMFLHGGIFHILSNLIGLWMFGGELEEKWGSKFFLKFYIYSGIGAGIFILLLNSYNGVGSPTIGASGAIYAILLGYGITWPDREVLLYFVIPVKIKYLVIGFGVIEFLGVVSNVSQGGGYISHIGHLGGLLTGFLILRYGLIRNNSGSAKNNFINQKLKKSRLEKKKKVIEDRIKAKKIIDELLEKIAKHGFSSLTGDEKKRLEWARKNYYPEGKDILH